MFIDKIQQLLLDFHYKRLYNQQSCFMLIFFFYAS